MSSVGKTLPGEGKGFSLIELVIVLVLIGLSISLVAPAFSRFSKSVELKVAAKKISGILRYYRSEAVQKGTVQQVLFDPELQEVRILTPEATEDQEGGAKSKGNSAPRKYPLPDGVRVKEEKTSAPLYPAEVPAIEFYPNGGSNGGFILLEGQNQKEYRIKVYFLTGMVEVEGT
jgi:general secretion pathway protein H